jgi:hypothetical protein
MSKRNNYEGGKGAAETATRLAREEKIRQKRAAWAAARATKAEKTLLKMVSSPKREPRVAYLETVHERNGVKVAGDGYIGGVILPQGSHDGGRDYDGLRLAYAEGRLNPEEEKEGITNFGGIIADALDKSDVIELSESAVKAIVAGCKRAADEYGSGKKRLGATVRLNLNSDFDEDLITASPYILDAKMANYAAERLALVCKFILCSETEPIQFYFTEYRSPLILGAGNLYAIVAPVSLGVGEKEAKR